ncbi:hypothetical protein BSNK01_17040 [Bacillaceae bacterium]
MAEVSQLQLDPEQLQEMSMVDIAYEILKNNNKPMYYRDLMNEIAKWKGLSEEEIMDVIAQVYTEINIDGRFLCVGKNLWGLKSWYPSETIEESNEGNLTKKKRKKAQLGDEEFDDIEEDLDEDYEDEEYDEYDGEDYEDVLDDEELDDYDKEDDVDLLDDDELEIDVDFDDTDPDILDEPLDDEFLGDDEEPLDDDK